MTGEMLCEAVEHGNLHKVRRLLNNGVDVNYKDWSGSVLHIACRARNLTKIVRELLGHDNIDVNVKNKQGDTPLHDVAYYNRVQCLKELLCHPDIDITIKTADGMTAAEIAEQGGNKECIKHLKEFQEGKFVQMKRKYGRSLENKLAEANRLLSDAIQAEDFATASILKATRDNLMDLLKKKAGGIDTSNENQKIKSSDENNKKQKQNKPLKNNTKKT